MQLSNKLSRVPVGTVTDPTCAFTKSSEKIRRAMRCVTIVLVLELVLVIGLFFTSKYM